MVHPEGAVIYPHRKRTWYGINAHPTSNRLNSSYFNAKYKYKEELLIEEGPLFAQGMYHTFLPSHQIFDPGELISQWKKDYRSLLKKYDTNADGQFDEQEWQCVIRDAEKKCVEKEAKINLENAQTKAIHILSSDGLLKQHRFILSGKTERELYRHKIKLSGLYWIGFILLFLHTLYALSF